MEYELLDTGVFNGDRYFDVFVEYAKDTPEDILIQISVCNRGPEAATLHVLPTLWFRNTWTWWPGTPKPFLKQLPDRNGTRTVGAHHAELGDRFLYCEGEVPLLFTENETNNERLFGKPNASRYVKDGIHNYVVSGRQSAVNPEHTGTKAAAHYRLTVERRQNGHYLAAAERPGACRHGRTVREPVWSNRAVPPARGGRVLPGHHSGTGQ